MGKGKGLVSLRRGGLRSIPDESEPVRPSYLLKYETCCFAEVRAVRERPLRGDGFTPRRNFDQLGGRNDGRGGQAQDLPLRGGWGAWRWLFQEFKYSLDTVVDVVPDLTIPETDYAPA